MTINDYLVEFRICIIAHDLCKLAHGMDANDAFESKIGLQAQRAGEIIG